MSVLVADCPRCGATQITFDLVQEHLIGTEYGWQQWFEAFCICRHCRRSTTFILKQNVDSDTNVVHNNGLLGLKISVNRYMSVERFVSLRDLATTKPPKHLPENIDAAFREGAACMSIGCYNAAATMFRLCIDLATRGMLPERGVDGLNARTQRSLGLRLGWLFENGKLPETLRKLSECIKDDGNDGAHEGNLTREDAEDLLDFTFQMLERIYTDAEKLRLAEERTKTRRGS